MPKRNPYKGADANTLRARKAGYPARSVFKLEEIDRRVRLFRPGMRVLDLGAAPGSWSLYTAEKIGRSGRLLAVDLNPLEAALPPPCTVVVGDARENGEALAAHAPYDVVLSDMAPSTTGNRLGDQTRSFELFMKFGGAGSAFVGKIFMGQDLPVARAAAKKLFRQERLVRPEATRSVSYEIFIVAQGKLAPASGIDAARGSAS
jgi:23S rRNA (uridine2552-2'-O)-methyltransferase